MLDDQKILAEIKGLSKEKQSQVFAYIRTLKREGKEVRSDAVLRPFGVIAGKSQFADDFNQPLVDFQDYMP